MSNYTVDFDLSATNENARQELRVFVEAGGYMHFTRDDTLTVMGINVESEARRLQLGRAAIPSIASKVEQLPPPKRQFEVPVSILVKTQTREQADTAVKEILGRYPNLTFRVLP